MTSLRMPKTLKSAVAVIVSGALLVSTAVTPAAAQVFRAGQAAEAGAAGRGTFAPSTLGGVQPLPENVLGSSTLVPALSPAAAPTALVKPAAAAAASDE